MTTYILHGGRTSKRNAQNEAFFAQFTELVAKETVTILLCYFSKTEKTARIAHFSISDRSRTGTVRVQVQLQVSYLYVRLPATYFYFFQNYCDGYLRVRTSTVPPRTCTGTCNS